MGKCGALGNAYTSCFYVPLNFYGRKVTPPMLLLKKLSKKREQMLDVYADFAENWMAVPVVKGVKTPNERFAGAWIPIALKL